MTEVKEELWNVETITPYEERNDVKVDYWTRYKEDVSGVIRSKARAYLRENKIVKNSDDDYTVLPVGDRKQVQRVNWTEKKCTCQNKEARCSHLLAVALGRSQGRL